jgi:hypothetical protein
VKVFLPEPSGPAKNKKIVQKMDRMLILLVGYHPKDSADLAAAISRASSGDAADPL